MLAGAMAGAISLALDQSLNFHIFSNASRGLLRGENLYGAPLGQAFKYSPSFALAFLPFAIVPAWLGAAIWSAVNFAFAWAGIVAMVPDERHRRVALAIALAGILLVTDGDQSNLIVAGAMLLSFAALERSERSSAGFFLALATMVKVFPIVGLVAASTHKKRAATFGWTLASLGIFSLAPLAVCSPRLLALEMRSWIDLLVRDHEYRGWSILTPIASASSWAGAATAMQLAGLSLATLPAVLGAHLGTDAAWRRKLASSLLVYVVLFNHRAEYASFVLTAIALAIWLASEERSAARTILVAAALAAPGPFFAHADPHVSGFFSVFAAHRAFATWRIVPLTVAWLWMLGELFARFVRIELRVRIGERVSAA
ncbi:MAG: glycosyltransferase family 87 protein [Polyangiaceae bacterium]